MIKELIAAGFKETAQTKAGNVYRQSHGWFGVTKYNPDAVFQKENKEVIISLQGLIGMHYTTKLDMEDNAEVFSCSAAKIIILKMDGKVLSKSFTGIMPDINSFINA